MLRIGNTLIDDLSRARKLTVVCLPGGELEIELFALVHRRLSDTFKRSIDGSVSNRFPKMIDRHQIRPGKISQFFRDGLHPAARDCIQL